MCPACRKRFTVPAEPGRTASATKGDLLPPRRPGAPALTVGCPGCGRSIPLAGPHELSILLECSVCQTQFVPSGSPAPPARPTQRYETQRQEVIYQHTLHETKSRNLWQWFVGLPVGILLLVITLLLVAPCMCCGLALIVGVATETRREDLSAPPGGRDPRHLDRGQRDGRR